MVKSITIQEVASKTEWNHFFMLPWFIYKNDPLWVPPLLFDLKRQLNKNINPFFNDAEAKYWIATDENRCIGRIAAIVNHQHNNFYKERTGFFGFFECIDDKAVAAALLDIAHQWLKEKGMEQVRGPVNLSLNNECGFLIDGYNRPPVLQMNYNKSYYPVMLQHYGYEKEHDLLAFYITDAILSDHKLMDRLKRISEMVIRKENIRFRNIDPGKLGSEIEKIRILFNDYMSNNWGFLPMTEEECSFMAKSLKPVLVKQLAIFAEADGQAIGSSLAMPDLNYVVRKMNGRLFPFGIFKYLYYKRKISDIRVMLMGINERYRRKGLEAVFIYKTIMEGYKRKITGAELSWISEDNHVLINELTKMNAHLYKRYRIYQMPLIEKKDKRITNIIHAETTPAI